MPLSNIRFKTGSRPKTPMAHSSYRPPELNFGSFSVTTWLLVKRRTCLSHGGEGYRVAGPPPTRVAPCPAGLVALQP